MTRQRVHRDSVSGAFVSAEYAEANPDTTQSDWIEFGLATSRLEAVTKEIVQLTESRPSWTVTVAGGIVETGTDPTDVLERALIRAQALVDEQGAGT